MQKKGFRREIPILTKIRECLRPSADIDLTFFSFLRFFFSVFLVDKMLNINGARVAALKKVSKIKSKGGL
ncbi:uncharacterized protein K441DRAFT_123658 [Cenococcum geophilum 1.58]|uniref:uncharacterized protein n=1 Tax=Cenococcum geophilum 1.58 TaxID=794803 RepID=UPI00358E1EF4|nr:hypothetical protein K441DRAFT_123658 [Cenococcum geophilum 1.58]